MDNVVDLDDGVVKGLLSLLGGGIGTDVYGAGRVRNVLVRVRICPISVEGLPTNIDGALSDHGTVGLVDDAIDLLQVIRVRDDLVVSDDVLEERGGSASERERGEEDQDRKSLQFYVHTL